MRSAIMGSILVLLSLGLAVAEESVSSGFTAYQPPLRGAPSGRFGGGARGLTMTDGLQLCALAPDHVGWTSERKPTLYWFSSRALAKPLSFTLTRLGDGKLMLQQEVTAATGGMHRLELEHALEPYQVYSWRLRSPSTGDSVGGELRYVKADLSLKNALRAENARTAETYASTGRWYDAIATLSRQIEQSPNPAPLYRQRSRWLEQVNLPIVSAWDRQMATR
ncbi:MAG: DUF928 domain-containing protein [Chromatiales bacterium]|nr:DUF928 domain-containing protein [Chromatiales bacterium]